MSSTRVEKRLGFFSFAIPVEEKKIESEREREREKNYPSSGERVETEFRLF